MNSQPPLGHLVDHLPPPDAAALRSIVRRRDRWVRSLSVLLLIIGLLGGGVLGAALRPKSQPRAATIIAASAPTKGADDAANIAAHPTTSELNHLATHDVNGVSVSIYGMSSTLPASTCVQVEASGPGWATAVDTQTVAPLPAGVTIVMSKIAGTAEGKPTAVVVAEVGGSVESVSVHFVDGKQDEMKPINGWVALTAPVSSSISNIGTLSAKDSSGATIVESSLSVAAPVMCLSANVR